VLDIRGAFCGCHLPQLVDKSTSLGAESKKQGDVTRGQLFLTPLVDGARLGAQRLLELLLSLFAQPAPYKVLPHTNTLSILLLDSPLALPGHTGWN
jgi:hypothetical protein